MSEPEPMDFEDIEARLYAQVFHTAALDDFEVVEPDTQNATASVQQNVSAIAQQNLTERYFTVNRNDTFQNVRVPADCSTDTPDRLVRSNIVSMGLMNSTSNVAAIPTILTRTFTPHFQKKGTRKDRRIQHRQLVHLKQKYERDINWRLQKETVEPRDKKRNKVAKENKSNDNLLVVSDDSSNDCFIIPHEIPLIVLNSDDEVDPTSKSEGTQEGTKSTIESLSGDLQNDMQIKSNMVTTVIDNTTLDKSNLSENKRLSDIDSPVISQSVTTGDPLTDSINYVLTNRPEISQNYKTKFKLPSPHLVIGKSQIISEACNFENVISKLSDAKPLENTVGDLFSDNTSHSFKQLITSEQSTRNTQLLRSCDQNLDIRHEVTDPPSVTNSESDFADGVIECRSPINKTSTEEGCQLLGSPKSDQAICKGQTRPKRKFFTSKHSKCNKQKATNTEEINDDVYIFTDSDSSETKIPYKRQRNSKTATDTRHLEYDSDSFSSEEEVFRIGARKSLDNSCTLDLDYSEIDSSSDESSLSDCALVIPENAAKEKEGESIIPLPKKHNFENYWCKDKERFYKENWGDENFSVVEKLRHMSNDPLKWKVLDRDKKYLKNICSKKSKRRRTAQSCKCILCGGSDHLEPACPNKVCRMCGNSGDFSSTPCDICQIPEDKRCSICKMFGHADFLCPDQWRRYIMTGEVDSLDLEDIEARMYAQVFHTGASNDYEIIEDSVEQNSYTTMPGNSSNRRYFDSPNLNHTFHNVNVPNFHMPNHFSDVQNVGMLQQGQLNVLPHMLLNPLNNIVIIPPAPTQIFTSYYPRKKSKKTKAYKKRRSEIRKLKKLTRQAERKQHRDDESINKEASKAPETREPAKKAPETKEPAEKTPETKEPAQIHTNELKDDVLIISDDNSNDCYVIPHQIPLIELNSDDELVENHTKNSKSNVSSLDKVLKNAEPNELIENITSHSATTISSSNTKGDTIPTSSETFAEIQKTVRETSPDSSASNDFLENSPELPQGDFNFRLHGCDFNAKDVNKDHKAHEACETESSASELSAVIKHPVFNEVPFENPADFFKESNWNCFKDFITPEQDLNNETPARSSHETVGRNEKNAVPCTYSDSSDSSSESDFSDSRINLTPRNKAIPNKTLPTLSTFDDRDAEEKPKSPQFAINDSTPKTKNVLKRGQSSLRNVTCKEQSSSKKSNKTDDSNCSSIETPQKRQRVVTDTFLEDISSDSDSSNSDREVYQAETRNDLKHVSPPTLDLDYTLISSSSDESGLPDSNVPCDFVFNAMNTVNDGSVQSENGLSNAERQKTSPSNKYRFEQYWSEDRKKFYRESWGDEDLNITERLKHMSDDPSKWKILDIDRTYLQTRSGKRRRRCNKCREFGHVAIKCHNKPGPPKCSLCGGKGHLEPRCPNKICTQCGSAMDYSTRFCSLCVHYIRKQCSICRMFGHLEDRCPDLWRRYFLTTEDNGQVTCPPSDMLPAKHESEMFCSGCARYGHMEYRCSYFNRTHPPTIPFVCSYNSVYKPENIQRTLQIEHVDTRDQSGHAMSNKSVEPYNSEDVAKPFTLKYPPTAVNAQPDYLLIDMSMEQRAPQFSGINVVTNNKHSDFELGNTNIHSRNLSGDKETSNYNRTSAIPRSVDKLIPFLEYHLDTILKANLPRPCELIKRLKKENKVHDVRDLKISPLKQVSNTYKQLHMIIYGYFGFKQGNKHVHKLEGFLKELRSLPLNNLVPHQLFFDIQESFEYIFGNRIRSDDIALLLGIQHSQYLSKKLLDKGPFAESVRNDLEYVAPCAKIFGDAKGKLSKMKMIYEKMTNTCFCSIKQVNIFGSFFESLRSRYDRMLKQ